MVFCVVFYLFIGACFSCSKIRKVSIKINGMYLFTIREMRNKGVYKRACSRQIYLYSRMASLSV
jgi:hypothetical protein